MKRIVFALIALAIAAVPAVSVGAEAPLPVTIMTACYATDPIKPDAEIIKQVDQYCSVDLKITFVPNVTGTAYMDKVNLTLASGDIPMIIMATDRGAGITNAVRQGAFWEIGPYLKDYPNLSKASDITLWNSSFEGKIYGLYRTRPLGRNGVIYRSDWLKNVGMTEPKTIDDFYKMLKAFTYSDPDKNGKNDTFGMALTKYMSSTGGGGPFDQIVTWFGGPNQWGVGDDGKLVYYALTKEYKDTLKFFKKLYDEKLINQDFAVFEAGKWNDMLIGGQAGCAIDVTDRCNKVNQEFERSVPGAYMEVMMGLPAGPKGQRSLATAGYNGYFLFSKQSIKDVATLKRVLGFMDKLGDDKMLDLCGYGISGRMYDLVDGKIKVRLISDGAFKGDELNDINQILPMIPKQIGTPLLLKPWLVRSDQVQAYNAKFCVGNPAAPFVAKSWATKGAQLDNIINEARTKYIVGQIDDKGWDAAIAAWKAAGGDDVTKEYNEDYLKYGKR
jgi:putative aldouronate transport system substrate-binding protein